jgi:hypothetical protein
VEEAVASQFEADLTLQEYDEYLIAFPNVTYAAVVLREVATNSD